MIPYCFSEMPEKLEPKLEQYIKYNPEGVNKIGHIMINDRTSGISQSTWLYVKKALEYYKEQKPIFIILELNTPGGEVFAAQNISDALKEMDIQYNIPVVCYINNWAISAGAMLAYSCRFIGITKDASMGAVEPVFADGTGETKQATEKVNSAMRSDLANRARFFDRNANIAEAMVDKDIILVLRNSEFIKLDNENQILATDELISPKGKLLTLDSQQLMKYHVADFLVMPTKTIPLTEMEIETGKWAADKSAIFHTLFFDKIPQAEIEEYKPDWKTNFFIFLANPMVASALFLGMMIGFYLEFNMPGASLPGTIGFICLLLIILSSLSLEIGNVLELFLLIVGIAIIAVELFLLPTFGLLGFVGVICFLIGLFGLMLPGINAIDFDFDSQKLNAAAENFFQRLALLSATLVLALGIMALLSKYVFPSYTGFDRFVLKGNEQTNYLAVESSKTLPQVGTEGIVFATLRPAGKVMIDQNIYDAISPGNFIEQNTIVEVVGFESGNIVVNTKKVT
jgi:membrane-bound ClpP family serine protease